MQIVTPADLPASSPSVSASSSAPGFNFLTGSLAVSAIPFESVDVGTIIIAPDLDAEASADLARPRPADEPTGPTLSGASVSADDADLSSFAVRIGPAVELPNPAGGNFSGAIKPGPDQSGISSAPAAIQVNAAPGSPVVLPSAPVTQPRSAPTALSAAAPSRPRANPGVAPPPSAATANPAPPRAERPALAGIPRPLQQVVPPGAGVESAYMIDVTSQLLTRIDGKAAGKIDFRQTTSGLEVRIGSLAEMLGDRFDAATRERMTSSAASNVYLSLAQLQAQGIPISYDPVYDEFNIGMLDTRPKAARKVHMDQISTPERGPGSAFVGQVPRPR
ncbi:hypothetical protein [Erythrobacter dokdonensis]|uniref:hypothetical protein n=1 Tax=Erythrobacter dokdonensis TaxID=328225 RepID=UPI00117C003D|nr:hypothetical protein [Erythrobacter dokdonensis]